MQPAQNPNTRALRSDGQIEGMFEVQDRARLEALWASRLKTPV